MSKFRRFLNRIKLDREGQVAVTFALTTIPVLGITGMSIDYGRALQAKTQIQRAADAAVLAGSKNGSYTEAERKGFAEAVFNANVAANGGNGITPNVSVNGSTISLTASAGVPTAFMRLFGYDTVSVAANSAAAPGSETTEPGGTVCVLALNGFVSDAFSLNGTTDYKAINCATYSNSSSSTSLRAVGTSNGEATNFYTAGDFSGSGNFSPAPKVNQPRIDNPLANLAQPASSSCASNAKGTSLKKGNHTVNPGTFCGGLKLQAQANVTFNPGIYVIKNGAFELSSGSTSYGQGVHFHFIGTGAHLKVRGGANADFKAMTTGAYAGIAFAQDPAAAPGATSDVQGGGNVKIVGAMYFPTQTVDVGGNGNLGLLTDAWAIIADKVRVHGNGQVRLKAEFAAQGFPDILPKVSVKPARLLN